MSKNHPTLYSLTQLRAVFGNDWPSVSRDGWAELQDQLARARAAKGVVEMFE